MLWQSSSCSFLGVCCTRGFLFFFYWSSRGFPFLLKETSPRPGSQWERIACTIFSTEYTSHTLYAQTKQNNCLQKRRKAFCISPHSSPPSLIPPCFCHFVKAGGNFFFKKKGLFFSPSIVPFEPTRCVSEENVPT